MANGVAEGGSGLYQVARNLNVDVSEESLSCSEITVQSTRSISDTSKKLTPPLELYLLHAEPGCIIGRTPTGSLRHNWL